MSLDKRIKELAAEELNTLVTKAEEAVTKLCVGTPLGAQDVARLVSGHKPQTTYANCVKQLSAQIGSNMLAALEYDPAQDDD